MMAVLFPNGVSTYTFAEDVSTTTASIVKENSDTYKGADVQIVPYREYTSGTFAPHIIGRTAAIDADEYAAKRMKAITSPTRSVNSASSSTRRTTCAVRMAKNA